MEEVVLANLSGEIGLFRFLRPGTGAVRQALELGNGRLWAPADWSPVRRARQRVLGQGSDLPARRSCCWTSPPPAWTCKAGELYRLLAGLNRDHGLTILMVSHDVDRICSYVSTSVLPGRRYPGGTNARTGAPERAGFTAIQI